MNLITYGLGLFAALVFSTSAYPTSFSPVPFAKTVENAPVMVRGKVGSSYVEWAKGDDGVKRIYTFYELQGIETLKGSASGPNIMIRELGGMKDGSGMQVSGASEFQKGEEVVVFLRDRNADSTFDIFGLMMGKLDVHVDDNKNETLSGPAISMEPYSSQTWTMEALKNLIQEQSRQTTASPTPTAGAQTAKPPAPPSTLIQAKTRPLGSPGLIKTPIPLRPTSSQGDFEDGFSETGIKIVLFVGTLSVIVVFWIARLTRRRRKKSQTR